MLAGTSVKLRESRSIEHSLSRRWCTSSRKSSMGNLLANLNSLCSVMFPWVTSICSQNLQRWPKREWESFHCWCVYHLGVHWTHWQPVAFSRDSLTSLVWTSGISTFLVVPNLSWKCQVQPIQTRFCMPWKGICKPWVRWAFLRTRHNFHRNYLMGATYKILDPAICKIRTSRRSFRIDTRRRKCWTGSMKILYPWMQPAVSALSDLSGGVLVGLESLRSHKGSLSWRREGSRTHS